MHTLYLVLENGYVAFALGLSVYFVVILYSILLSHMESWKGEQFVVLLINEVFTVLAARECQQLNSAFFSGNSVFQVNSNLDIVINIGVSSFLLCFVVRLDIVKYKI